MCHFLITYRNFHRKCRDAIRPVNDIIFGSIITKFGKCSAYINLNTFRHTFTDFHIMLTAHIFLNIGSKIIPGNTNRVIRNDTAQRYYSNFRRATTYINNHVPFGCLDIDTDTDSSCHRLKYQINVPATRMFGRVTNGTQLNLRTTGRDTNHHTQRGGKQMSTGVDLLNKSAHHLLASIEVGNYTVTQRTDCAYIFVGFFMHQLCLFTHGNHLICTTIQSYHRRFVHYNLTIGNDDSVGSAKVHRNFLRKRE